MLKDAVLINVNAGAIADDVKPGVQLKTRARQPLDLAYCAAVLEKNGFSCNIIDALILNLSDAEIVRQGNARHVIINTSPLDRWECPYLSLDKHAGLVRQIREVTKAKITFIGPHGTVTPQLVFEKADIDLLVMGEPEYTVLEIVKGLPYEDIQGLAYKENNVLKINSPRARLDDLDQLPFPAYHLLPMGKYSDHVVGNIRPFSLMISSRGCPFKCTFCMKKMWGDKYRVRSIERVIEEIELLQKNFGIKAVYFQDLEFCINKKRVEDFCNKLIEKNINLTWACSARLHDIDEQLGKLMKASGCAGIIFGLESGSQKILDNVKKNIDLKRAAETIKTLKKIGIQVFTCFQMGLPGETKETLKETVRFAVKNNIEFLGGGFPISYPGAEIWDGKLTWEEAGRMAGRFNTDILNEFTEAQLFRYVRLLYIREKYSIIFFLNPYFYVDLLQRLGKKIA